MHGAQTGRCSRTLTSPMTRSPSSKAISGQASVNEVAASATAASFPAVSSFFSVALLDAKEIEQVVVDGRLVERQDVPRWRRAHGIW